ncbi:MAG: DUF547 domain-containing protein [Methylococcales bacterium]
MNSYNILAIKMVLDHWPVESIKDAGGLLNPVWNQRAGEIGGEPVTLGQIEHKILRPMGEPRIHFAIVCASVSCPNLYNQPYTAARLNTQLDEQVRGFSGNEEEGMAVTGVRSGSPKSSTGSRRIFSVRVAWRRSSAGTGRLCRSRRTSFTTAP